MSLLIAWMLAQAVTGTPGPAQTQDDSQRVEMRREFQATQPFTLMHHDDGSWSASNCNINTGLGDAELDAAICDAITGCAAEIPKTATTLPDSFNQCVTERSNRKSKEIVERRKAEMRK